MDRFSTRLAASIITDRQRAADIDRRAGVTHRPGDFAEPSETVGAARRVVQQLARPFGLRPAR